MQKFGYFEILTYFVVLTDPREDRGRNHNLLDLVALVLCGTICLANTSGRTLNGSQWRTSNGSVSFCSFRMVSHLTTRWAVFSQDLTRKSFRSASDARSSNCSLNWRERRLRLTERRSHDNSTGKSALHVVSAWANHVNFCLG